MRHPPKRRHTSTYRREAVISALDAPGISWLVAGHEIDADVSGSGHYTTHINPQKGVWFDHSTGRRGTVSALLRSLSLGQHQAAIAAPRPAQPTATGEKPSATTIHVAQRLWGAAWTCTYDLPGGWDKGLNSAQKGTRRAALEHNREVVRAYLTSRLGPDHLGHWTRQVRIGDDLMLTPMQSKGQVVGIQRTYFDHEGQKVERKMLGRHGVHALTPPPGVTPHDLGTGKTMLLGEGWETTAAAVQATGWGGLVGYYAGGAIKWAQEQALQAKSMAAEQIENAPAVVVLVDRDESQTGQKSAAKAVAILRNAGLKAFYAIPPMPDHGGPRGGQKGSDWGDYPKEGLSSEVLAAHLALAIAHGDQEMPEIDEPGMALPDDTAQIRAWRPAANPQTPAQSGPTHEVRAGLQTALQQTVADYLAWLKGDDKPFAPVLMMPTTGTGKSTAAKALTQHVDLRMKGRVCVFVPDHAQATEYENAGFFHFYGRNPEPRHPGYCPAHETIEAAQEQGHISQAEVCRQCSHGYRWAIDYYSEINDEQFADKIADAKAKLAARGLDWTKVTPCVWQRHLRHALEAQFVVAASGSYSHSLTRDSLVIFDEHFEPGKGVQVTLQDVDHWARRNQSILDYLESHNGDPETMAQHRQADDFFRAVALAMAAWVGKSGAVSVDEALLEAINGILEAARASRKHGDDVALAAWETLKFNAAGEMSDNPLRAAHAIAESLKFGDGHVTDGQLVVAASLPVMERLAAGQPTVIMDATPDPVIVDVVQAQGGQIANAIAHQNVKITRHPTRFWGLTPLNIKRSGADRRDREIEKYKAIMGYHEGAAFLFHKKAADGIDPNDENPMLGHWGRHHRAHNDWSLKPLVVVGSFFPPMEAWRAEYQVSRIAALSAGADGDHWPAWKDDMEMVKDAWICEGDHEVQCRLPLPDDQHIRTWLLIRVASETVQAIGRARGANSENAIDVHIYGGVPLHGLWQHGLSVDSYEDDPECLGQTKDEHMHDMREQRQDSFAKVDVLAARAISKGQTVTRAALEAEAMAMAATSTAVTGVTGLCHGGYNIHTTPAQRESTPRQIFTMPHERVVQEWFATRAPILSQHLSTTGRNARVVKTAQEAAQHFGEEMVKEAMQMADLLFKSTGGDADRLAGIAWDAIEYGCASDAELVAARLVLVALGETEGAPPPW